MNNITVIPIKNLPEFEPKHDLADEIIKSFSSNNFVLEDKDVIVITQKIVSKVEDRLIKDDSTNWHTFFIKGLSENGFREYMNTEPEASLEDFFG